MRPRYFACALLAGLACGAVAEAQTSPGADLIVNPSATGSRVLLYPGGKYSRVVHPLLQPGEPDPNAPIHLHMPAAHPAVHRVAKAKPKAEAAAALPGTLSTAPAEAMRFSDLPSESASTLVAPERAAPAHVAPKPPVAPAKKVAAVPKPSPTTQKTSPKPRAMAPAAASPTDMTFLSGDQGPSAAMPPPAKPAKVASSEPAPASSANLSRKNSILFSPGAEEPAPAVLDTVKAMSGDLNSALTSGSARIQLEAYGGKQNDKGSDARRLSLKRALIVRQLLIDDGVPSERIDVRAMGGASDGAPDRVDIFVRA